MVNLSNTKATSTVRDMKTAHFWLHRLVQHHISSPPLHTTFLHAPALQGCVHNSCVTRNRIFSTTPARLHCVTLLHRATTHSPSSNTHQPGPSTALRNLRPARVISHYRWRFFVIIVFHLSSLHSEYCLNSTTNSGTRSIIRDTNSTTGNVPESGRIIDPTAHHVQDFDLACHFNGSTRFWRLSAN